MTALQAVDGGGGDWIDLMEWSQYSGADTTEQWRRAVFGVLVGNVDNHLRNHGFLRNGGSWVLSPVFDVNPTPPGDGDAYELTLDGKSQLSLEDFTEPAVLDLFGVSLDIETTEWLRQVRSVLEQAPALATAHGADAFSMAVMEDRFTHAKEQIEQVL